MRKLAVFDLDGTLFRWQLYHELVFEFKNRGLFDDTTATMLETALLEWQAKRRSWHDYEMEIINAFEPVIEGLDPALYDAAVEAVVKQSGHKTYAYTMRLLKNLQKEGYFTLAVSGSQQEIAESFAQQYGFDDCIGALYERNETGFTGAILRRVPGRKREIVEEYLALHPDLTLDDSIAIGDSDGDISLLEIASNPIAFNPSHDLMEVAQEKGWTVVIERKDMAYTLKRNSDGLYVLEKAEQL